MEMISSLPTSLTNASIIPLQVCKQALKSTVIRILSNNKLGKLLCVFLSLKIHS